MPHNNRYGVSKVLLQYWKERYGEVPSCRLCDRRFVEGDEARELIKQLKAERKL